MANRFDYRGGDHEIWLQQIREPIEDPQLAIVDAHHHLWIRDAAPYLLREFADDLHSGHNIVGSVFAECHSMYRQQGPKAMQSLGEMEFVAGVAAMSDSGAFDTSGVCQAAVGNVDLLLGDDVAAPLEGLMAVSGGRFRGVRASVCWHPSDALHRAVPQAEYLAEPRVRDAIAVLERMGFSLDCWLYHTQIPELTQIAAAFPSLRIILNHCGTPILGGPYRDKLNTVQSEWHRDLSALAKHDNVFIKLGALPAKFDGENKAQSLPPSSADIARAWSPWIMPAIELFGATRCMFESNFPVHKNWMSYAVLWNAFKIITAAASPSETAALFAGTAIDAYQMNLNLEATP